MRSIKIQLAAVGLTCIIIFSCKKQEPLTISDTLGHFTEKSSGTYFVTSPTVTYKIPVGLSTVSDKSRTVTVSVSSPTGAVMGTQYTLSTTSVVIPAGKAIDSIEVKAVYSQYTSGRKDSLLFTIQAGDGLTPAVYNSKFTLIVRGACFQSDIATNLQALVGDYNNTIEQLGAGAPYGPYHTKIVSATLTGSTTADIVVANIFDDSPTWNNLTYTLDWSNPANQKITLLTQNAGGNAGGLFGASYNGMPFAVGAFATQDGTFDFCAQKLTLRMKIGVFSVGFSTSLYQVNMAR
jgi:hypothetical protein